MREAENEVVRGLAAAARLAGISRWTLRDMIEAGNGPPHFCTEGGHYRFPRQRLIEWRDARDPGKERSA